MKKPRYSESKIFQILKSGRITTHYSAAEIDNLIEAASRVTRSRKTPALTVLNFARGT